LEQLQKKEQKLKEDKETANRRLLQVGINSSTLLTKLTHIEAKKARET
jgi:hypothetical protein